MLPHYSAFKVAESFRMLEALAPGRIDIGLGRAPGGTRLVSAALESRDASEFPRQLIDLIGFLRGSLAPAHPLASLVAMPSGDGAPEPWILGSSEEGASIAASLGLPYVYAHFITGDAPGIPRLYRRQFRATSLGSEPRVMIATAAIAAPTDDEAQEWYAPLVLWRAPTTGSPASLRRRNVRDASPSGIPRPYASESKRSPPSTSPTKRCS
jgi:luciferase family oxidoreductase group 1